MQKASILNTFFFKLFYPIKHFEAARNSACTLSTKETKRLKLSPKPEVM
jgi:hypothetical protein